MNDLVLHISLRWESKMQTDTQTDTDLNPDTSAIKPGLYFLIIGYSLALFAFLAGAISVALCLMTSR